MWYNDQVGTSIRIASVILLLAMAGGRVSTVVCEIACLNAAPASPTVQFVSPKPSSHACHESAPQSAGGSGHIAAGADAECHGDATVPFVLTANSIRDSLATSELALSALQNPATPISIQGTREHTRLDLHRAPIVQLRI